MDVKAIINGFDQMVSALSAKTGVRLALNVKTTNRQLQLFDVLGDGGQKLGTGGIMDGETLYVFIKRPGGVVTHYFDTDKDMAVELRTIVNEEISARRIMRQNAANMLKQVNELIERLRKECVELKPVGTKHVELPAGMTFVRADMPSCRNTVYCARTDGSETLHCLQYDGVVIKAAFFVPGIDSAVITLIKDEFRPVIFGEVTACSATAWVAGGKTVYVVGHVFDAMSCNPSAFQSMLRRFVKEQR